MRKVMFQYFIPAEYEQKEGGGFDKTKMLPGTNVWSDHTPGIFHTWGSESTGSDNGESVATDTVAIIENVITGKCHQIAVSRMRFVQPPESTIHKSEKENRLSDEGVISLLKIIKNTGIDIETILTNISKKIGAND